MTCLPGDVLTIRAALLWEVAAETGANAVFRQLRSQSGIPQAISGAGQGRTPMERLRLSSERPRYGHGAYRTAQTGCAMS